MKQFLQATDLQLPGAAVRRRRSHGDRARRLRGSREAGPGPRRRNLLHLRQARPRQAGTLRPHRGDHDRRGQNDQVLRFVG